MRRKRSTTHEAAREPHPSRRIHDEKPDQQTGKLPAKAVCPRCNASYQRGRWTWKPVTEGAYEHVCPACERIASDYPAGVLHVEGDFAASHRDELIGLFRNIEERERSDHPLKRIIAIRDEDGDLAVTVTDGKLAETFGRALKSAYEGRLDQAPTTSEKSNLVRVRWTRS